MRALALVAFGVVLGAVLTAIAYVVPTGWALFQRGPYRPARTASVAQTWRWDA
jgi:hypothetical protein